MQVDRNAESDPIFQEALDLEYGPKNRISQKPAMADILVLVLTHIWMTLVPCNAT
jgi:hypothetical protein